LILSLINIITFTNY